MDYIVRNLTLYQNIICGADQDNGNGILYTCSASVSKRSMNPAAEECLAYQKKDCNLTENILPAGTYLFVQGYIQPGIQAISAAGIPAQELYDAALALWLEFVWQEITPPDSTVYVRLLVPEEIQNISDEQKKSAGTVFQLYRRKK